MNKLLLTAATLALLSTTAFAVQVSNGSPGDGADTDPPRVYEESFIHKNSMKKNLIKDDFVSDDAFTTNDKGGMEPIPNYINRSQLR